MKVFMVASALIAITFALPPSKYEPDPQIIHDIEQFAKCVDGVKTKKHIFEATKEPAIQHIFEYLASNDFKNHIRALDKDPTYLAILTDLEKYGVNAYENVNAALEGLSIEPIVQLTKPQDNNNGETFDTLFDKLISDIDKECTKRVFDERLKADNKFKDLVDHLKSDEYNQLVEAFKASETVKQTLEAFNNEGLDLAKYVEYLKSIFHYDW